MSPVRYTPESILKLKDIQPASLLYREEPPDDRKAEKVDGRRVLDVGLGRLIKATPEFHKSNWAEDSFWFSPVAYKAPYNFELWAPVPGRGAGCRTLQTGRARYRGCRCDDDLQG